MKKADRIKEIKKEVEPFPCIEINQFGYAVINLDDLCYKENSAIILVNAIMEISKIPEYSKRFDVTYDIGYYDAIENKSIEFSYTHKK